MVNPLDWLDMAPDARRAVPQAERPDPAAVESAAQFLEFQRNYNRMTPAKRLLVDLYARWLIFAGTLKG